MRFGASASACDVDQSFCSSVSMMSIQDPIIEEPMQIVEPEYRVSEYDLGAGGPSSNTTQMNSISQVLEKIMEESFAEKADKISQIRVKYEVQMQERREKGMYSDIVELKTTMEEEIEAISEKLTAQRRIAIANAQKDFKI